MVLVCLVLGLHFIGDFILQSDWMAQNKSKNWFALCSHVAVYSLPFSLLGWQYALQNAGLHLCIDFVTSRINSKLWAEKKVHWFFVSIGFDQLLHSYCLILTLGMARPIWNG